MNLLGDKIKVKRFRKHIRNAIKHQTALRMAQEDLADAKSKAGEQMWKLINDAYPETKGRRCSITHKSKGGAVIIEFLDNPEPITEPEKKKFP